MEKPAVIAIQNLSKRFKETDALKKISLSVEEGMIYGIIGRSGAGKSTLIHCLTALERPSEGSIAIAGEEISTLSGRELRAARRKIGMIFQHFNLFSSRTALENVLYPLEVEGKKERERAYELLELVGLKGKEQVYPAHLSGGQKQRVAIARALASGPKVLLCDEPTSALDPETTQSILDLLAKLNRDLGITIVIITHEMEVVKQICTHVAVLDQGAIVEQGSVTSLFAKPTHPITKRFLQNIIHEIPAHLFPSGGEKELLRLCFTAGKAEKPIISQLIRRFDVEVNILLGGIDSLKEGVVGSLVVELTGSPEIREQARHFLKEQGVILEEVRP